MSGHSPATRLLATRIGSWLALEALPNARSLRRLAWWAVALVLLLVPLCAYAARHVRSHSPPHSVSSPGRPLPYPQLELPLQIGGSQYAPLAWSDIAGWNE